MTSLWIEETANHIIKYGRSRIHTKEERPLGVFCIESLRNGQDTISLMNEDHVVNLDRYVTDSTEYFAYLGVRHTQVELGIYRSFTNIVIYDIATDTFLIIDCDSHRLVHKFRNLMYNSTKILVFRKLYQHYYMRDITFREELSDM